MRNLFLRDSLAQALIVNERVIDEAYYRIKGIDDIKSGKEAEELINNTSNNISYKDVKPVMPKEPYTPVITSLYLSYTAEVSYTKQTENETKQQDLRLFHLYPFEGFQALSSDSTLSLLPSFPHEGTQEIGLREEGTLYIGLKDIKPPTALPLLFQVAEETALVSDTPSGFVFRYREAKDANQGESLMRIRQNQDQEQLCSPQPQVGIGTNDPQARLDINDAEYSQVHILPEQQLTSGGTTSSSRATMPVIMIADQQQTNEPTYLTTGLGDDYNLHLEALEKAEELPTEGKSFVFVAKINDYYHVRIFDRKGDMVIDAGKDDFVPNDSLLKKLNKAFDAIAKDQQIDRRTKIELVQNITSNLKHRHRVAGWVSNAERGFVFRQVNNPPGIDSNSHRIDRGDTHLAIREDGRIGIGTEEPCTNLEIAHKDEKEQKTGKFFFSLDQRNPALRILNIRPGPPNHFTIGTSSESAVLMTDSKYGFEFIDGTENKYDDLLPDGISPLVSICAKEGKSLMGIGTRPTDYELEVKGMTQALTFYQKTKRACLKIQN